jgi:hypothetical protein
VAGSGPSVVHPSVTRAYPRPSAFIGGSIRSVLLPVQILSSYADFRRSATEVLETPRIISRAETQGRRVLNRRDPALLCASASPREWILVAAERRAGCSAASGTRHHFRAAKRGSSGFRVLRPQRRCASVGKTERGRRKEKRRFRGEYTTCVTSVRSVAIYDPPPSTRVVVRGRREERTAHWWTPPAKCFDGRHFHPPCPLSAYGRFLVP